MSQVITVLISAVIAYAVGCIVAQRSANRAGLQGRTPMESALEAMLTLASLYGPDLPVTPGDVAEYYTVPDCDARYDLQELAENNVIEQVGSGLYRIYPDSRKRLNKILNSLDKGQLCD